MFIDQEISPDFFGDVMDKVQFNQNVSPENESLLALLTAWHNKYGENWMQIKTVIQAERSHVVGDQPITDALNDLRGNRGGALLNANAVGKILQYRKGKIVGGYSLEVKNDSYLNCKLWRVVMK